MRLARPYITGCGCSRCEAGRARYEADMRLVRARRERRSNLLQCAAILLGLAIVIGVWFGLNVR